MMLHTAGGDVPLAWPSPGTPAHRQFQADALEWSHIVRNRARWVRSKSGAANQDERARALLASLGVSQPDRERLAKARAITVALSIAGEEDGWEAQILPWEFLLSAATRDLRTGPVGINRWLLRDRAQGAFDLTRVLFVESAPGRLGLDWSFSEERRLVEKYTKAESFERLTSPTRRELADAVADLQPHLVHLAGFDIHQGLALLGDGDVERALDQPASGRRDGYLLASGNGVDPVPSSELAALLAPKGRAPHLVFCNIWNSAARTAPLLVAAGVDCAIGFQDSMDDALAEMFAASFYQALAASKDVAAGFDGGWRAVLEQPKSLRGTGIVLWRGGTHDDLRRATGGQRGPDAALAILPFEQTTPARVPDCFAITVEPEPLFSYGLLHNNRDLFRRFVIRNLTGQRLSDVEVFVELHSNDGTYPFRRSFAMDGPVLDLSREIRIALTSNLARTLEEVLRTSLYVRVSWGTHQVFSRTFPVTLAPVDQWTDTDADRMFLPSFVFPRDQAVRTVIKQAEHFVTALRDDPAAGFDGYQSIDPDLRNPAEPVDRQVQALWYSIVYKVPASYINPPPTYALLAQRIRTPSEVVGGGFGTCIDLALMLAACLEAVEIHPVMFLLEDHAFPGYWRTPEARDAFMARIAKSADSEGAAPVGTEAGGAATAAGTTASWAFDRTALPEILEEVTANRLIPLESVNLTARSSIAEAIATGRSYFEPKERTRFLSMLDIQTAREMGVTPLPLGQRLL